MNERIKELMVQAGFDPVSIERMGVMPQAVKFAELIIEDCKMICRQNHRSDVCDDIAKHFHGVTK